MDPAYGILDSFSNTENNANECTKKAFRVLSLFWMRIFRIICYKFRFLGVSLALLNSGSEVQSSALLTSPPENTGQSSLKTP